MASDRNATTSARIWRSALLVVASWFVVSLPPLLIWVAVSDEWATDGPVATVPFVVAMLGMLLGLVGVATLAVAAVQVAAPWLADVRPGSLGLLVSTGLGAIVGAGVPVAFALMDFVRGSDDFARPWTEEMMTLGRASLVVGAIGASAGLLGWVFAVRRRHSASRERG